jgi:hypothetical protein
VELNRSSPAPGRLITPKKKLHPDKRKALDLFGAFVLYQSPSCLNFIDEEEIYVRFG